jgi:hypothetical protein
MREMTIANPAFAPSTPCTRYILSAWKVVQMTQPEFVDSHEYFDALVLKYLS